MKYNNIMKDGLIGNKVLCSQKTIFDTFIDILNKELLNKVTAKSQHGSMSIHF